MTLREFLREEIARTYPHEQGGPDLRAAALGMGVKYTTLHSYAADTKHPRSPSPGALGRILDALKLGERKCALARRLLEEADARPRTAAVVA